MLPTLRVAIIVLGSIAVVATGTALVATVAPSGWVGRHLGVARAPADDTSLSQLAIGGPFRLADPNGRIVDQTSYPGRWRLIYFGYTSCPDICPTTLQSIAAALAAIGPQAERVAPLFITIDPARDRPEVMARYTGLFDRRIIGLTGTDQQIAAAERGFRVYAARVDQPGTRTYMMDHTSFVYLLDPQGHLIGLFDRNVTAADLAAKLRKAIG